MKGGSAGCQYEPRWPEFFSVVAKPDASEARKKWAAQVIREMQPTCTKLKMSPTSCYGCPENPLKEQGYEDLDAEAYALYASTIEKVARMIDATEFGWLSGSDVTSLEFALMRAYYRAVQSRRML